VAIPELKKIFHADLKKFKQIEQIKLKEYYDKFAKICLNLQNLRETKKYLRLCEKH
jgi:hypothetical protein